MKLVTYALKGSESVGAVIARDKIVLDLKAADRALARSEKRQANTFFGDMLSFLSAGSKAMAAARKAVKAAEEKLGDEPKADGKTTHFLTRVKQKRWRRRRPKISKRFGRPVTTSRRPSAPRPTRSRPTASRA